MLKELCQFLVIKMKSQEELFLLVGGSIGKEVGKLIENNTDNISLRIIELKDEKNAEELVR